MEATVSTLCWPWAFRRELPTTTANGAVIVATTTTTGDIKGEALGLEFLPLSPFFKGDAGLFAAGGLHWFVSHPL